MWEQCLGQRFGYVLWGDEVCLEAEGLQSLGGGRADGGDLQGWGDWVLREGFDGVGAGQDQPVEGGQVGQSLVECCGVFGRGDLDGGDEDWFGSKGLELGGEVGALGAGTRDE